VRIALVSDTHLPRFGRDLPRALRDGLTEARPDLILHAGDLTSADVPSMFERFAPFDAVAGNNDHPELAARFGRRKVLDLDGLRVGLVHGDLGRGRTTPERAARSFGSDEVDLVVFGHSHIPLVERLADGRWLVNPGSPTDRRRQARYSWAIADVSAKRDGPRVEAILVTFADRTT
jgi:putative phosphoesterase